MYIYLIWEREFWSQNINIYKIGKSKQENCRRLQAYPKGSRLIMIITVEHVDQTELELINIFKQKFIQRSDIGTEYFQGDCKSMIDIISKYAVAPKNIIKKNIKNQDNHINKFLDIFFPLILFTEYLI